MTDFLKFSASATVWFFVAGFIYTGGLFFAYEHSHNAPAFFQGIVTMFEGLILIFAISTSLSASFVIARFVGRSIGECLARRLGC